MKKIICSSLLAISLLSLLVSSYKNFPYYEVELGPVGGIALFSLWAWMLLDLIKSTTASKKLIWVVSFIIFNTFAAVIYFFRVFNPKEPQIEFIQKLKIEHQSACKVINLVIISFTITILHLFFVSNFYIIFGIPFPELYSLIVNKIIYMPLGIFLEGFYNIIGVDLTLDPVRNIELFTHTASIAYTTLLYMIVLFIGSKIPNLKSKYSNCG
jgi:hypothetical protein